MRVSISAVRVKGVLQTRLLNFERRVALCVPSFLLVYVQSHIMIPFRCRGEERSPKASIYTFNNLHNVYLYSRSKISVAFDDIRFTSKTYVGILFCRLLLSILTAIACD